MPLPSPSHTVKVTTALNSKVEGDLCVRLLDVGIEALLLVRCELVCERGRGDHRYEEAHEGDGGDGRKHGGGDVVGGGEESEAVCNLLFVCKGKCIPTISYANRF